MTPPVPSVSGLVSGTSWRYPTVPVVVVAGPDDLSSSVSGSREVGSVKHSVVLFSPSRPTSGHPTKIYISCKMIEISTRRPLSTIFTVRV